MNTPNPDRHEDEAEPRPSHERPSRARHTPSASHTPRADERHEDRGISSRESGGVANRIRENPELSVVVSVIVTTLMTLGGSQVMKSGATPGASSVQIESVSTKVDSLATKFDALAGDVRSIREADLVGRTRRLEDFLTKQEEVNRETAERRRDWADWRKMVDAKLVEAKIAGGK